MLESRSVSCVAMFVTPVAELAPHETRCTGTRDLFCESLPDRIIKVPRTEPAMTPALARFDWCPWPSAKKHTVTNNIDEYKGRDMHLMRLQEGRAQMNPHSDGLLDVPCPSLVLSLGCSKTGSTG